MRKNTKITLWGIIGVMAISAASFGLYQTLKPAAPDPQTATPDEVINYLSSDRFAKLAVTDRQNYMQRFHDSQFQNDMFFFNLDPGNLSEEKRLALMKNVLPAVAPMIKQRLNEYESLPQAQQMARLDTIIDHMLRNQKSGAPVGLTPQRLNLILQYLDPETRAQIRKHVPDLLIRMGQRSIKPPNTMANRSVQA